MKPGRTRAGRGRRSVQAPRKQEAPAPAAQSITLLAKFVAPGPTGLLRRARVFSLIDRLRRDHPVIWVSAPGGAGKTSVAASYLAARKLPALWYQLDESDGEAASFFYNMGRALHHAVSCSAARFSVLSPEYLGDLRTFARNYFRQLFSSLPRQGIVVFDNYQDVPEQCGLHELLRIAFEEAPGSVTVLVLSRADPPPGFARSRLSGRLAHVDWSALKLTVDEAIGISALRMGKSAPDARVVSVLRERTEGWAAGFVLLLEQHHRGEVGEAALAAGDRELLFDYFVGETLARSAPAEQAFLVKTALLPKISAEAATALTGIDASEEILEGLMRRNYFTVRREAAAGDSYEYHPLFREFLLHRAERAYAARELAELRMRAAEIVEGQGDIVNAVELRQKAADWDGVARLIIAQAETFLGQGRGPLLLQWLERMPRAVMDANPWLLFWRGICGLAFDPAAARLSLEAAYERFRQGDDARGVYATWSAVIDSFIYEWANFTPMLEWIKRFEGLATTLPVPRDPPIEAQVASSMFMGLMYAFPNHSQMGHWANRAETILRETTDAQLRARVAPHFLMYQAWWCGDLGKAKVILDMLRPALASEDISPLARITWAANAAAFLWLDGDTSECVRVADDGLQLAVDSGVRVWDMFLCAQGIFGELTGTESPARAERYLERMGRMLEPRRMQDTMWYYYHRAPSHFLSGDLARSEECAREALSLARKAGYVFGVSHIMLDVARVLFYRGRREEAMALVVEARNGSRTPFLSVTAEYLSYLTEAEFALLGEDEEGCVAALRNSLAIASRKGIRNHTWWRSGAMALLYSKALEHDIEPHYVKAMIGKRRLAPPDDVPAPDSWPFAVRIFTLGHFAVHVDGEPLTFPVKVQKKPLELLKALIAFGGKRVPESRLAEVLWPQAEGDAAQVALTTTLHRLRRLLGEQAIERREGQLGLNPGHVWVDIWSLEQSLGQAETESGRKTLNRAISLTRRLQSLYRGGFMPEVTDFSWVIDMRERLRASFLRGMETLARYFRSKGDDNEAIACYESVLAVDPLAENVYRGLMATYLAKGARAEALAIYRRCCRMLDAQLGVSPSPETERIIKALKAN